MSCQRAPLISTFLKKRLFPNFYSITHCILGNLLAINLRRILRSEKFANFRFWHNDLAALLRTQTTSSFNPWRIFVSHVLKCFCRQVSVSLKNLNHYVFGLSANGWDFFIFGNWQWVPPILLKLLKHLRNNRSMSPSLNLLREKLFTNQRLSPGFRIIK